MPKIIFKMGYIKGGSAQCNYTNYIATREGVDKDVNIVMTDRVPSENQTQFITQFISDFPDSKDSFEYEDYIKNSTMRTASQFISSAAEQTPELFSDKGIYVNYIATRPKAYKVCDHGLFGAGSDVVNLNQVKKELKEHKGNVWTPIISLRREDADRLGYNNAEIFRTLINQHQMEFAEHFHIDPNNLRWYAAFHDKDSNPHVHMIVYSVKPREGYISKDGIDQLRSSIARDIFKQELYQLYDEKTITREKISDEAKEKIADLVQQINQKNYSGLVVCDKLLLLSEALKDVKGKKVYGYLRSDIKAMVDDIVREMASDKTVAELYKTWCDIQNQILGTYKSNYLEHPPLWENKEFKKIKNAVISEALKIGNGSVFVIPADIECDTVLDDFEGEAEGFQEYEEKEPDAEIFMEWTTGYKEAMECLHGSGINKPDLKLAFEMLSLEAEDGNVLAIHDLGLMFRLGFYVEENIEIAQAFYTRAFNGFSYLEAKKRNPYIEYRLAKLHYCGFGTEQDYANARKMFLLSDNKYSHYWLGKIYYFGYDVEQNYETAAHYYRMSAEENVSHAQYALGKLYFSGEGVRLDYAEAAMWFERAAIQGNPFAQYRLGRMYYLGLGVEKNDIKALGWLTASAKQGNQFAQYALGKMYKNGEGTVKNEKTALKYFLLAADQKNHYAQYEAAELFYSGEEINIDIDRANILYRQALIGFIELERQASSGEIQYRIAKMFEFGLGTDIDMMRAIEYYEKAAAYENSFAELKLAKIYFYGIGTDCDRGKAMEYLDRAIEHGNEYAEQFKTYILQMPSSAQSAFYLFARLADMIQDDVENAIRKHNYSMVDRKVMTEIMKKKQEQGMKF